MSRIFVAAEDTRTDDRFHSVGSGLGRKLPRALNPSLKREQFQKCGLWCRVYGYGARDTALPNLRRERLCHQVNFHLRVKEDGRCRSFASSMTSRAGDFKHCHLIDSGRTHVVQVPDDG